MSIPKNYFHDRVVLLLLSINTFLTVMGSVLIFWQMSGGRGNTYLVTFRDLGGIPIYRYGQASEFLGFVLFLFFVLGMHTALSMKIFSHHRSYALTILGLGTLLSVLTTIVGTSLLFQR
ncbi:hypothetical protein EKI60_04415 [Candidatus Saccharibacteria bacterium]|nr:MAG: hypothetical protein EKI60_04415 [Candidatus Saccharibacteria bacterium]